MFNINLDEMIGVASSATGIKALLELAESIPYPREDCNWVVSLVFDFIQRIANNSARKGVRRPVGSFPSWQPGQTLLPAPATPQLPPAPSAEPQQEQT